MASMSEIAASLEMLSNTVPSPRGVDPDKAFDGYVLALSGFSAADIDEAIRRYLSGAFPKISLKFYPRAPELASCVRAVMAERSVELEKTKRAEQLRQERLQDEESKKLQLHTAEQKAHVAQVLARYIEETERDERIERARVREMQRAETRARYGMTDDLLAKIPDAKPLPKGMVQAGQALPEIKKPEDLPMYGET